MEYLDSVNRKDEVLGKSPITEIYEKGLIHRIVHVLIFDEQGRMALQLRTPTKSFCPDTWSTAVGGHVQSGESYEEGALREYQEELGTTSKIELKAKDFYEDARTRKFLGTFTTVHTGPFHPNPEDVQEFRFFSFADIQGMIDAGERFHPELLFLLEKYFGIRKP